MHVFELKLLIFSQIGIDIVIAVALFLLIKRLRAILRHPLLSKGLDTFESLLTDADSASQRFEMQLQEKNNLIQRINDQLDLKISSLNQCMNRADALLVKRRPEKNPVPQKDGMAHCQKNEIGELAEKGRDIAEIATALSIPKEEVRLVLDLKKRSNEDVKKASVD